jgi:hypothetical protein
MNPSHYPSIDFFIEQVVDHGSHCRIDEMEELYTPEQSILLASGSGHVERAPCAAIMADFTARRAAGDRASRDSCRTRRSSDSAAISSAELESTAGALRIAPGSKAGRLPV